MSLKIWLPLDGDLRNQGLSNVSVIQSGSATVSNAGKIGKCYSFGTAKGAIQFSEDTVKNFIGDFSFSLWINMMTWNASYETYLYCGKGDSPWASYIFGLLRNASSSKITFVISDGTTSTTTSASSSDLSLNTWYHITCTYSSGKIKMYVNGVLDKEISTSIVPNYSLIQKCFIGAINDSGTYQTNSKINDVRIYDHCLSQKEITEISRGLSRLYKFNEIANENICGWVSCGSNAPGNSTSGAGRTIFNGGSGIILPCEENLDTYFCIWLNKKMETGKTYTVSADVSGITGNTYYNFPMFNQGAGGQLLKFDHNGICSVTFTMTEALQTYQTTSTYNGITYYKLFLDDNGRAIASGQGKITVSNIKAEEGNIVTSYRGAGQVADDSGYLKNGDVNGSFKTKTNSPRYETNVEFSNTSYILSEKMNTDSCESVSFWVKVADKTTNQIVFADYGSKLAFGFNSGGFITSCGNAKPVFSSANFVLNQWNHIVVVNSATQKLYLNGVEVASSGSNNWTYSDNYLRINGRSSGTLFTGDLVDFRVYATELDANAVTELYKVGAEIDKSGNFYAYEYKEV